ncbi:MAG: hypothetical protein HQL66_06865 [Magnetococcales bacterium]|nr:hypothetical protein [Magnetococcales bacterium]
MEQNISSDIIRGEEVGETLRVVRFAELLARTPGTEAGKFIRVMPNGQIPKRPVVEEEVVEEVEEPAISPEEVFQRRQENVERETFRRVFSEAEKAGLAMGRQQIEQELSQVLPRLESLLRGLEELPARLYIESESLLVETAIALVREILGYELQIDPHGLARRVTKALVSLDGQKEITLAVNPLEALFLQRLPEFKHLRIRGDDGVGPGSFRMESRSGGVEHNLQAQLRAVEEALRSHLRERLEERSSARGNDEALATVMAIGSEAAEAVRAQAVAGPDADASTAIDPASLADGTA